MSEGANKPKDNGPGAAWPQDPMLWPYAATKFAVDSMFWWIDRSAEHDPVEDAPPLPWTTPNKVALELCTMRLRDFSRARNARRA